MNSYQQRARSHVYRAPFVHSGYTLGFAKQCRNQLNMNQEFDETAKSLFDSLLGKSFEMQSEEELSSVAYNPPLGFDETDELPLFEEDDRDILMHRDAHFSSSFPAMLEEYENEGMAAVLDVFPDRIKFLMDIEERLGRDLAPFLLQGADAERVAQVRKLYQALSDQINTPKKKPLVSAIAELILSEESIEKRAQKTAKLGPKIVPYLIQLIETALFYDPLFPGYGQAPIAAAMTLGILKANAAIKPLFQLIGTESFDIESAALIALSQIGDEVKEFCLKQLKARPLSKNNERASILASSLEKDQKFYETILQELEDPQVQKIEGLATYLVLACAELPKNLHEHLKKITASLPVALQEEIRQITKS